jgi:hypothetical protein
VRTAFVFAGGNTPIASAIDSVRPRVIVLPKGIACALDRPATRLGPVERLRYRVQMVVVPPLCLLAASSYEFSRGGDLIDRAAESTASCLTSGGLRNPGVPGACSLTTPEAARVLGGLRVAGRDQVARLHDLGAMTGRDHLLHFDDLHMTS